MTEERTQTARAAPQTLWQDGDFALLRGLVDSDGTAILVLAAQTDSPEPRALERLKHEWSFRELSPAWAACPRTTETHQGRPALTLTDPGGVLLAELTSGPWEIGDFLRVAKGLTVAIKRLHERGIVHKDIKPSHVFVDCRTGDAWLTGFGIASRVPRQRQTPEPPETLTGTLAYMSPEQSGRMNRSVDRRSDVYSLGVTLYEMLTGTLPFSASDAMGWVHCHIAQPAVSPCARAPHVPLALGSIVLKLLAKAAEDRYQTAEGLEADLSFAQSAWEAHGAIPMFELGRRDVTHEFVIPEKLYGRERDVEALTHAFRRVADAGRPELVLVAGYSGVGKSSVVSELHQTLVPSRALFASGKFDQYKRHIPHATLAQAAQQLMQHVLTLSDEDIARWRGQFREALGANGKLVTDIVPELELVIGAQAEVPAMPTQDAKSRFQRTFRRFIGVFARREHPLALFVDDLHWLDDATLALLKELVTDPEMGPLLLIGAYRDNEVGPDHPLWHALAEIREHGAPVHEIVLAPLPLTEIGQLLSDSTRVLPAAAAPLAELVWDKTRGNPFFAIQFLTALYDDELLRFDAAAGVWIWDLEQIRARGFTDNVVELMVEKLRKLPEATREALMGFACLGNLAEIADLTAALGVGADTLHEQLWEAVRIGVIFRRETEYVFLHDRVQEAAYELISHGRRARMHLTIGERLLSASGAPEEKIFEIVGQLNRGRALLVSDASRLRLSALNLAAGKRAKSSAAYTSALSYLTVGSELLPKDSWRVAYELTRELYQERAACEVLNANFDAAEPLILELWEMAATNLHRAEVCRLHVQLALLQARYDVAVERALECLKRFGIHIPAHPSADEIAEALANVWSKLGDRPIESLVKLPRATDPDVEASMAVLSVLFAPAFFSGAHQPALLYLCKMVELTLESGLTEGSAYGFGWFGVFLAEDFDRYHQGLEFGKLARALAERHGFTVFEAQALFSLELLTVWTCSVSEALDVIRLAFQRGVESGDISVACYACNHAVSDRLTRGDALEEVLAETESGLAFARRANFRDVVDILVPQQRFVQALLGNSAALSTFDGSDFSELAFERALTADRMTTMVCWYWLIKGQLRYLALEFEAADEALEKARPMLWASPCHIQNLDYYYFSALTVAARLTRMPCDSSAALWRERLEAHCHKLAIWAESYPPTFADKYALVRAELARLSGNDMEAIRGYELAIAHARKHGFVQNEAIAHEVAARFHTDRGFETGADAHLYAARQAYARWGALAKVRQLEELRPLRHEPRAALSPVATMRTSIGHLDLENLFAMSRAVSGEMVLDRLLEKLMRLALEHAGAERGLLLLAGAHALRAEASASTGPSGIQVVLRPDLDLAEMLPVQVMNYVAHSRETVVIADAAATTPFSSDPYIVRRAPRSILCLPLVKLGRLIGVFYLDNHLTSRVFSADRTAVLELLASQAAVSLDNARLYGELQQENAERRQVEEALGALKEQLRLAIDTIPEQVFTTRPDGNCDFLNQRWQEYTGLPLPESLGRGWTASIHADDLADVTARWSHALATVTPMEAEARIRRHDGAYRWFLLRAVPLLDDAGNPLKWYGASTDIEERKRAEAALQAAQAELSHVSRVTTLGELTASIAHEINQPLGAIVADAAATINWLSADPPNLKSAREALSAIVEDGQRAAEVLARIRALLVRSAESLRSLDLTRVAESVVPLVRHELSRHSVVLETAFVGQPPCVLGDSVQLQQVILNLLLNAIEASKDFGPERRRIALRVRSVEGRGARESVELAVEDAGVGLGENVARCFEPFFSTKASGLGMGLSISRSIIERHHGALRAMPNPEHGSTFYIELPAAT